jgi:hypothetical protein
MKLKIYYFTEQNQVEFNVRDIRPQPIGINKLRIYIR